MHFNPDDTVFWQYGWVVINETLVMTWLVMLALVVGAHLVTRNLAGTGHRSTWQTALEAVVQFVRDQIREVGLHHPERYLDFLGTLFVFIAAANLLHAIPGCESPTASLSTTTALALCVFAAVPYFGIRERGLFDYLCGFFRPNVFMFPLHVLAEVSRTVALAVRLFGNIMSESVVAGVLLMVAPLFFPVLIHLFGLLTGMVQAFIFFTLATVFIAAATSEE